MCSKRVTNVWIVKKQTDIKKHTKIFGKLIAYRSYAGLLSASFNLLPCSVELYIGMHRHTVSINPSNITWVVSTCIKYYYELIRVVYKSVNHVMSYLCSSVFITARIITFRSLSFSLSISASRSLSSNCFYLYTVHIIRCSESVRFDFLRYHRICKEIGLQVRISHWMTRVNRSVIVLHFNCFTFHTYSILFSFTRAFLSLSFPAQSVGCGLILFLSFFFYKATDRYRYNNILYPP